MPDSVAYLLRNSSLSFVAEHASTLVGCVISGHDGRGGYLQHLIVLPTYRKQGIGSELAEQCIVALGILGILKTHIDVFKTNLQAQSFWEHKQ